MFKRRKGVELMPGSGASLVTQVTQWILNAVDSLTVAVPGCLALEYY